ncbi:hypothetical protein DH2020_012928 [Rehmannia glutinosa]|uniref:U3 small nucleolar ribonucleoprotein protein MPP10 n=1 Tax=Rehmannia glutinosa TaxID=99300 RepID=A0ABR0X481_REHGL
MPTVAEGGAKAVGLDALHLLKSTEPPLYLTPSSELSNAARLASEYLFSSLSPYAPKSPFTQLLTEGFDAEQIWQQIDLQAQPLLSSLRRHVRNFEKNPEEIKKQFSLDRAGKEERAHEDGENKGNDGVESESEGLDDDDEEEEEEEEEDEEGEEDDDGEMENDERENGVEDKFLKIKELEEYLAEDEAREYGLKKEKRNKRKIGKTADEDEESEDEEGNEEDEDEDDEEEDVESPKPINWINVIKELKFCRTLAIRLFRLDVLKGSRTKYEDFFVRKKGVQKKKPRHFRGSDDMDMDESQDDDDSKNKQSLSTNEKELAKLRSQIEEMEKANLEPNTGTMQGESLSTHEKELARLRSQIEEMEKANLEPKTWTMQGEVTAAKRPKNSALEVDLDFEHNVRPAPVITEEVTASLEELIQKRVLEDENKSKKGLAELYEDEYAQKTGLVSTALSFSDEQKKEASMLFKKLCVKLDALSHFHFTPKPVIEDMSIQANVPALAMEEIAPVAVSDAAMLAPEEVFSGKGDIKEETELTQAERKRRRANKKRKFKAKSVKKMAMKAQQSTLTNRGNGAEEDS